MVSFLSLQVLGAELAILDEIDSGLDVDALQDVAKAVNGLLTPTNSVLMITHYQRLLDYIKPTLIHIMVSIVAKLAFFTGRQRSYGHGFFCQKHKIYFGLLFVSVAHVCYSVSGEWTNHKNRRQVLGKITGKRRLQSHIRLVMADHRQPLFLLGETRVFLWQR